MAYGGERAIVLPVPALVLLVGVSGAGKSTFARRHFAPTEVLSSDHCRAMICDDPADQAASGPAFGLLRYIARRRLAAGRLTVVDATNVLARSRRPLLQLAGAQEVPAVALVLDVPEPVAAARAAARAGRPVGAGVVAEQHAQLRTSLACLPAEGFAAVHVLRQSEVDTAVIVRRAPVSAPSHTLGPCAST